MDGEEALVTMEQKRLKYSVTVLAQYSQRKADLELA